MVNSSYRSFFYGWFFLVRIKKSGSAVGYQLLSIEEITGKTIAVWTSIHRFKHRSRLFQYN